MGCKEGFDYGFVCFLIKLGEIIAYLSADRTFAVKCS